MKKIEKILPEHIAGYLPYELKTVFPLSSVINTYKDEHRSKLLTTDNLSFVLNYCKPILKPIKSLTTEELSQFSICFRLWYNKDNFDYNQMIYSDIEICHMLHVDYRGLIESGLAVEK